MRWKVKSHFQLYYKCKVKLWLKEKQYERRNKLIRPEVSNKNQIIFTWNFDFVLINFDWTKFLSQRLKSKWEVIK